MVKLCPTCKIEKHITEYGNNKSRKDGFQRECKTCSYLYNNKHYHAKLSPRLINIIPEGCKTCTYCKETLMLSSFKPQKTGRFGVTSLCKICFNIKWNLYQKETKNQTNRNKIRRKTDPQFKLKQNLRGRYMDAIKRHTSGGKVNKSHSAIDLIGCTIGEYVEFLENLFYPEMTWENHGTVWEIDHIKPCDAFNLIDPDEQKTCFHYSNTTPLFKTTEIAISLGYNNILGNRNKNNIF
jgi:hypothetical protein